MQPSNLPHGTFVAFDYGDFYRLPAVILQLPNFDGLVAGAGCEVIAVVVHLRVVDHVLVHCVERVGAAIAHAEVVRGMKRPETLVTVARPREFKGVMSALGKLYRVRRRLIAHMQALAAGSNSGGIAGAALRGAGEGDG